MKSENKEMERTGNLPNFLVIGAQKAGSTWLYNNLKCHTDIFMPKSVELLHFNRPDCLSDVRMREYSRHFDKSEGYKRVGEKTPGYFGPLDQTR